MSKIYKYTLSIFALITLFSCVKINLKQSDYQKDIKSFPRFLVDNFPDSLSDVYLTSKGIDTTNDCIFYINYSLRNNSIQEIKRTFEKKCIAKYMSNDSSLLSVKNVLLFEFDKLEKKYYKTTKRNQTMYYPILYFEAKNIIGIGSSSKKLFKPTNQSGLSDDFTIYIFDSKPGTYWKGAKDLDYMPDGWKRGYSKGACINEKEQVVIYWFVVW